MPPGDTVERRLRDVLRDPKHADGLTVAQLCALAGTRKDTTYGIIHRMPDAYIDRWTKKPGPGCYAAVWCVVVPPPNCPPPQKVRRSER